MFGIFSLFHLRGEGEQFVGFVLLPCHGVWQVAYAGTDPRQVIRNMTSLNDDMGAGRYSLAFGGSADLRTMQAVVQRICPNIR